MMYEVRVMFSDGTDELDNEFDSLDECLDYVRNGNVCSGWFITENGVELENGIDYEI